ncbi:VOC family protein [Dehalococcoidia bacterium]|nr:VOC family protein [Dehalococcoidia bacterium]
MAPESRPVKTKKATSKPVGVITGINHIVLVAKDLDETIHFYRDVLGLKLIASTYGARGNETAITRSGRTPSPPPGSLYFFALGNGDTVGFFALSGIDTTAEASYFDVIWPEGNGRIGGEPRGLDHLAFNLDSRVELEAIHKRIAKHGFEVSDIDGPRGSPFTHSFYMYDPNGIPLEFATFDYGDPVWKTRTSADLLKDPDPPTAARKS